MMLEPPRQTVATAGQPGEGPGQRADRDDRVLRFPVPVLPPRPSDGRAGARRPTATASISSIATTRCPIIRTRGRRPRRRSAPTSRASSGRITTGCSPIRPSSTRRGPEERPRPGRPRRRPQFNACVDSHKYKAVVDADIEGRRRGRRQRARRRSSSTAARSSGAQPFEAFKQIIDEELALKSRRRAAESAVDQPRSARRREAQRSERRRWRDGERRATRQTTAMIMWSPRSRVIGLRNADVR